MEIENNKLEKVVNFLKSKKLIITLLLSASLIFFSTLWYPLIYAAALVLIVGICLFDFNDIFCTLIFSSMLGCFLVPFISSTIVAFVAIVVKYIIDVKKKRAPFLKMPFAVTTLICVLYSLIHYEINDLGVYQGLMIIAFLYFIYFVVVYRKQLNLRRYFDYLFLGLIVSIVISVLVYFIPGTETLVFDSNYGYVMTSMHDKVAYVDGEYVRIVLLSFHVNHLAAFCLFAMAFSSIFVLTKKGKTKLQIVYYILMYVANLAVGLLTLSKAFIIVFAFEIFVTLIYYIIKHKKQAFKIIGIVLAVIGLFCVVFRHRFIDIFERFFVYNYDTLLGMLTTGRSGIWQQYANAILESPLKLLFGFGLFSKEQLLIGPHNFYIFLLYRFGIIGILLIAYLIYCYCKSVNNKLNFSVRKSLVFLTFLVIGLQESCIDERFYFFVIGIAFMFIKDKPKNVEKQTQKFIEESKNKEEIKNS